MKRKRRNSEEGHDRTKWEWMKIEKSMNIDPGGGKRRRQDAGFYFKWKIDTGCG